MCRDRNHKEPMITLEDILSWLTTGEIEGVSYDEASIIEAIGAELTAQSTEI